MEMRGNGIVGPIDVKLVLQCRAIVAHFELNTSQLTRVARRNLFVATDGAQKKKTPLLLRPIQLLWRWQDSGNRAEKSGITIER